MRILLAHPDADPPEGVLCARHQGDVPEAPVDAVVGRGSHDAFELARTRSPGAVAIELDASGDLVAALREAERAVWRRRHERADARDRDAHGRRVLLVGAGIVNLMTAWRLVAAGCRVMIVDAATDPRAGVGLRAQGTTHGGHDARMCSLTESTVRTYAGDAWTKPVDAGGWLPREAEALQPGTTEWIRRAQRTPAWLLGAFAGDIDRVNAEGVRRWADLRAAEPALFEHAHATDRVLHVCADAADLEALLDRHRALGADLTPLSRRALAEAYPRLGPAPASLAGGFLSVGGTLQIHRFCNTLLDALERRGVVVRWGTRARGVVRDTGGRVRAIVTRSGEMTADDYVLSIGAGPSLDGFVSSDAVRGVLGVWAELDRAADTPSVSIKAHMGGPIADCVNVIPAVRDDGSACAILGAGYMLVERDSDRDGDQAAHLCAALEMHARALFPGQRLRRAQPRHCVRPFTANGLGVFEVAPAASGVCVVTGGHNTGGFVHAPVVAEAALDAIRGRAHPLRWLMDPARGAALITAEAALHST